MHVNNHSLRNEINVVRTFRDIEVQICPIGIVERYKIGKEWDRIHSADEVCRWTINDEIHCSSA